MSNIDKSWKVDRLRARRSNFAADNENFIASDEFTAPMELKNKEKRELLRDIKYQSAELRETGDVQSNSQVIYIFLDVNLVLDLST